MSKSIESTAGPSVGRRPSKTTTLFVPFESNPPPRELVDLRVYWASQGRDVITGGMLKGKDARHWLRTWAGLAERFVPSKEENQEWKLNRLVRLVQADGDCVTYIRDDKVYITLTRTVTPHITKKNGRQYKKLVVNVTVLAASTEPPVGTTLNQSA